jgi:hypothetical protein
MSESFVMQVFFDAKGVEPFSHYRFDKSIPAALFGVPIVVHNEKPVGRWAIEYVSCSDERWFLFGPFNTKTEARESVNSISAPGDSILGYRIWEEHCFPSELMRFEAWTDG